MVDYTDLPLSRSSSRTIDNGTQIDRADDGTPWIRNFYAQSQYLFRAVHAPITQSQANSLQLFYETNKTNKISFLYKADGKTYNCYFTAPPQIDRVSHGIWQASASLTGTAWSPSQLFTNHAGVLFNFQNSATLIKDTVGSIVAASGDTVEQINDLSGGGNNATQSTVNNRTTLQVDASGKNYLNFDGLNDCYDMTGLTTASGDHTFIIALEPAYSGSGESWLFDAELGRLVLGDRGDSVHQVGYFTNGWRTIAAPTNNPQILTFVFSGSTGIVYRGNTVLGSDTYTPVGVGGLTGLCANHDGTGFFYKGKLYGMLLVDKALTTNLQAARNYLSAESGIPL